MTTPTDPEHSSPAADSPEQPAGPVAAPVPGPPLPPAAVQAPPPGSAPYPEVPQPAYPFAPVARAPRMPWVNPARRGHVAASALGAALLFGGGGVLIGTAINGHGGADGRAGRYERGPGAGGHGPGRNPRAQLPGVPRQYRPAGPNGPQPAPSASTTS